MKLENWQIKDFVKAKENMLKGGFATYRDVEYLALEALTNIKYENFIKLLVRRYPLIIIDECQDLSEEQLTILQTLADGGARLHFVGDLHQAIYGFRDVDPVKVNAFVKSNEFVCLKLTRNFRSSQNIVNLCAKLTGRDDIIGNVTWLKPRCLLLQYKTCPTELIEAFEQKCFGLKNTVVVSRGHSIINKFRTVLENPTNIQKLAIAIKQFNPKNLEALSQSLLVFSEFLRYHLKETYKPNSFNCPQAITSNLLWRKFLYDSLDFFIKSNLDKTDTQWSVWAKKAKGLIRSLPKQSFCSSELASVLEPLETVNLVSPSGLANLEVASSLGGIAHSSLQFKRTTIHGAKGETHDATIVISTARSGGDSHWKDWLKDPEKEAARFAYVASSRPKELLIWAVKTLKPDERKQLEDIGFEIV